MLEAKCPTHDTPMVERKGRNGTFLGCSTFKESGCRYTIQPDGDCQVIVKRSSNTAQMFAAVIERLVKIEAKLDEALGVRSMKEMVIDKPSPISAKNYWVRKKKNEPTNHKI